MTSNPREAPPTTKKAHKTSPLQSAPNRLPSGPRAVLEPADPQKRAIICDATASRAERVAFTQTRDCPSAREAPALSLPRQTGCFSPGANPVTRTLGVSVIPSHPLSAPNLLMPKNRFCPVLMRLKVQPTALKKEREVPTTWAQVHPTLKLLNTGGAHQLLHEKLPPRSSPPLTPFFSLSLPGCSSNFCTRFLRRVLTSLSCI